MPWYTVMRGYLLMGKFLSQSRARMCRVCPSTVALLQSPSTVQAAFISSGKMLSSKICLAPTPLPFSMPEASSMNLRGVYFLVIATFKESTDLSRPLATVPKALLIDAGRWTAPSSSD